VKRFRFLTPLALVLGLLTAPAALAHTVLIGSTPAAGSTIAQLPEQITLTFASSLLTLGSASVNQVEVTDPMDHVITSSDNVVHGAVLSNVLAPSMVMAGTYKVVFRVAAQDGHILNGSFIFNVGDVKPAVSIPVPHSGHIMLQADANGAGVLDGVGSATDTAHGDFSIDFSHDTFCYRISTAIRDVTAVHIHAASQKNMTISDEIFLPLDLSSINAKNPVCQSEPGEALATLAQNAGRYIFMLHTKRYPNGDVAGELRSSGTSGPVIHSASVTAAKIGGDSAIALSVTNSSSAPILITSITSAAAATSMIFYDANMCQGNSTMHALANVSIAPGAVTELGYKYQGAMLGRIKSPFVIGTRIPLTVTWTNNQGSAQKQTVVATVVAAPKGLNFGMSSMSGMSM